jgi:hypothetical protein
MEFLATKFAFPINKDTLLAKSMGTPLEKSKKEL